jgi:hypothetical protein
MRGIAGGFTLKSTRIRMMSLCPVTGSSIDSVTAPSGDWRCRMDIRGQQGATSRRKQVDCNYANLYHMLGSRQGAAGPSKKPCGWAGCDWLQLPQIECFLVNSFQPPRVRTASDRGQNTK